MKLRNYKIIILTVGLIGILLLSIPIMSRITALPSGEQFSVIYLLDADHNSANYPFNIASGKSYTVYLDVINRQTSSTYYIVTVKFLSDSDLLPEVTTNTPSSASPLYSFRFVLQSGKSWESAVNFQISDIVNINNQTSIGGLRINGANNIVNKQAIWNASSSLYHYNLLFELWQFNAQSSSIDYTNRFVYLQLNCTQSAL